MIKNRFKLSDFCITRYAVPQSVADKIHLFHIIPLNLVRHYFNMPIYVSQKSGYRPRSYELSRGRNGLSPHTFKINKVQKVGKGAVDLTFADFGANKEAFISLILEHTDYTRIAVYGTFIHLDYEKTRSGKRERFNVVGGSWQRVKIYD